MLRPRITPCLLIKNGGLVKTINFNQSKYVGDPLNAVRIFNEKGADELIVLDIDATSHGKEPNYTLIQNIAAECCMPLCYGGGVKSVAQIQKIISLGVEKVSVGAAAVSSPELISEAAKKVGSQSIVVVLDYKKSGVLRRNEIFTHNGTKKTGLDPVVFAQRLEALGAGEIVLNSIERDGKMDGYDLGLIKEVRRAITLPLTVLGGAGSLDDIIGLIQQFGLIGAAAGSLFVFKGKYRAVLINYPGWEEKNALLKAAG